MIRQYKGSKRQRGFTLIELMIVVAIIGILSSIGINKYSQKSTTGPSVTALFDAATTVASIWSQANQACGTGTDVTGSLLPATQPSTSGAVLDVVFTGSNAVAASCKTQYTNAGLKAITGLATGSSGAYTIQGYSVTVSGGGTNPFAVKFAAVPVERVLMLYNKYSSVSGAKNAVALPASADTTDPVIQFTAPASGTADLTILQTL